MIFHAMEASLVASVTEVIVVGDTPLDLRAGKNAGVRGIVGVLSGASKEDQLRPEPHTDILSSVAELPALLASLRNVRSLPGR
jgi:phosphoglycolate phosphatase-like HAD superfamily hydrolase